MRNLCLLLLALLNALAAQSQTYPFNENFQLQVSSQVPQSWSGDMLVRLNHGQNDGKGLTAKLGSTNRVDSVVTPLIGPFTNASSLVFFYRVVDQYIYPSTPTLLTGSDSMNIQLSPDGINWHTVFQLNEDNHAPTLNFVKKKVFLTQNAGESLYLRFYCNFGGSGAGYFIDIDSIVIADDAQLSLSAPVGEEEVLLYPNPVNAGAECRIQIQGTTPSQLRVVNVSGQTIFTQSFANIGALSATGMVLPVATWLPGVYFVHISGAGGRCLVKKLVIQ